jgi:hypothetical protein
MNPFRSFLSRAALAIGCLALFLALPTSLATAAETLTQQIDPTIASVGDEVTVTITVQNGDGADIHLPQVDGLRLEGNTTSTQLLFNNGGFSSASSQIFTLVPVRAGDFTIPAFDVQTQSGQTLHVQAMKLHVTDGPVPSSPSNPAAAPQQGPVVMPPVATVPDSSVPGDQPDLSNSSITPPVESDGRPAKVFMVITPTTTDAYVGETLPLKIEFFIRLDVLAQQDSLPTIKGSDFLINDLSVRPAEDELELMNEPYRRETWMTAISAPKSGDFPLQMERDTYWSKTAQGVFMDPLGSLFGRRPQLAHANIPSNPLVVHVHDLPPEGRPEGFTGAIGEFRVTGNATPPSVEVGDPVYLNFSVTGEGNFDSVRSPSLVTDPNWKSYVPSSRIDYADESHTEGQKNFRQAIIPKKNGTLPLPAASFSYFDPTAKKYVTVPIDLPPIMVTGSAAAAAAVPAPAAPSISAPAPAPATPAFLPNRLDLGSPRSDLAPAYRQPWFWLAQGFLLLLLLLTALLLFIRVHRKRDNAAHEKTRRLRSLRELETAMSAAVERHDAPTFFLAARQAIQLQRGAQWQIPPEAVTLPLVEARDPELAEALAPLFTIADEVMYSGHAPADLDLAAWERRVREELLPLTPARAVS